MHLMGPTSVPIQIDDSVITFNFVFAVFAGCFLVPPQSFRQVGFTVAGLFPDWLGSEAQMFVRYHVRRGWATLVVHSVLLGSYLAVMGWVFRPYIEAGPAVLLRGADGGGGGNTGEGGGGRGSAAAAAAVVVFWLASVAAVAMACVAVAWRRNEFQGHPLVKELDLYPGGWQESAMQIDIDHARMDKIVVPMGSNRTIFTRRWAMATTPYGLRIARLADVDLSVVSTVTVPAMDSASEPEQILSVKVTSVREGTRPFTIRVDAGRYTEIQDHLDRPMRRLPHVQVQASLAEQFLAELRRVVRDNPVHVLEADGEAEDTCAGCLSATASVKICTAAGCRCRPMWCLACLCQWFVSQQQANFPETWLGGEGNCPTCRSKFNVRDIFMVAGLEHISLGSPAPS